MNVDEQSTDAPRRSGRERKQVVSVYTEAKIDAKKKAAAAKKRNGTAKDGNDKNKRTARRKQRAEESDDEEIASEEEDYTSSDEDSVDSDDDDVLSTCDVENAASTEKPVVQNSSSWDSQDVRAVGAFKSVDGSKIFYGEDSTCLSWEACTLLVKGQKALIAKQCDDLNVTAQPKFRRRARLTQVPYHKNLLPSFEYFSTNMMQKPAMESFKMTNFHMPPSPWLENSIISVLQSFSDNHGRFTSLELSNCSLSSDDFTALTTFLADNTTITTLNISRNNITSLDAVKALAKAIKKHPALRNVNLGHVNFSVCEIQCMLKACKTCDSLEIGHEDFDPKSVEQIAKFLGKKNSLASFSLVAASVDKDNKKLLSESLVKNKTLRKLRLHSNKLQLPGIIRSTKRSTSSRLTHLDLSYNSLQVAGVKAITKFLGKDSSLVSLVLTNNHLTAKGVAHLLPVLKENTTLQHLDLRSNWLNDSIAPLVIDVLGNNITLTSLDLSGNKSLTAVREERTRYSWWGNRSWTIPRNEGGRFTIVKGALFNTTSINAIVSSNHTCAVKMSGYDNGDTKRYNKIQHFEETIYKINALDVDEGKKIRLKVVLALKEVDKDKELYNSLNFDTVPLELMPCLLELFQQRIGYNGFGRSVTPNGVDLAKSSWDPFQYEYNRNEKNVKSTLARESLSRIFDTIMSWQSLPQLFVRGPGEVEASKSASANDKTKAKQKSKSKSKTVRRKRRKFGDPNDDDDEAFIPQGGRKRGKWIYNSETRKSEYVPPPVY